MVFACGISSYSVTIFHLANHAFFKALLFLSAGSIIHAMHDEQDMRKMGALNRLLPFTYTMTLIGSFALIGFPFLTGYYSKDFILEIATSKIHFTGNLAYWLGTISVSFTSFYSYRLLYLTYINKTNSYKSYIAHTHEANLILGLPLALLAIGSLFVGYLTKDMIVGLGSAFWGNSILILSKNMSYLEAEYLPYHIKMIPFLFSHIGILVAYHTTSYACISGYQKNLLFYKFLTRKDMLPIKIYTFFSNKWHIDDLYNRFLVEKFLRFGYNISFSILDAGWIAYLGPYGIAKSINKWAKKSSQIQTGFVYHYAFIILIGITLGIVLLAIFSTSLVHDGHNYITTYGTKSYFIFVLTFFCLQLSTRGGIPSNKC
jgi:NADH-ubiquinone oxidoreductase chain 5